MAPSQQKRPRREPTERATCRECNEGSERRGDEAKLARARATEMSNSSGANVRQNR